MADEVISTVESTAIIPELWSERQFEVLLDELVFSPLINTDYEGEVRNLGDTVNIHSVGEFDEATLINEVDRVDADAATIDSQQLVINKWVAKDFIVTNKAKLQSLPFVDKMREKAVYSIMKKMEMVIIETIIPSASAPDHQIPYDSGTTLQLADLLEGKELLDTAKVPSAGRHAAFGPAQLNDIFNITGFTSSDFMLDGGMLQTGQLAKRLLGFMPHFSTLVESTTYLWHESFMTLAVQKQLGIEGFNLGVNGQRAGRINCDLLFGIKQLDDARVVEIA